MALLALQPNIYGTALAVYLPFCVVLALHRVGGPWIRLWFAVVTAAVSFALLLTLSRGAWLGRSPRSSWSRWSATGRCFSSSRSR